MKEKVYSKHFNIYDLGEKEQHFIVNGNEKGTIIFPFTTRTTKGMQIDSMTPMMKSSSYKRLANTFKSIFWINIYKIVYIENQQMVIII